ncbi:hypothetical protein ACVWYF_002061 [Hymenobacter sp. UYAg731]
MKIIPLLFALLSALAACSSEQEKAAVPETPGAAAAPLGSVVHSAAPQPAQPRPAAATKTTYQLLQGKWQSREDAKSVIELKGHRYIDYYDGKQLSSSAFVLDRACPSIPGAGQPGDNEKYLVEPQEDMCWEVVGVDEESLELSYTARGNSLSYRKIR